MATVTPATTTLTIGTRASKLARWQADRIAHLVQATHPHVRCRVVPMSTTGDRELRRPLPEIGGKGVFTAELEEALRNRTIDAAVHSLKDLPTAMPDDLVLAAVCQRVETRDVLISRSFESIDALPAGGRVGTSSPRRVAQLALYRPDLQCVPIRGNIDTRVRKAMEGDVDAVVIAGAGVRRLGLDDVVRQWIPFDLMLPAPGQGALAVQARRDDAATLRTLATIDEVPSRATTSAERSMLEALGGGCSVPVAGLAEVMADSGETSLLLRGLAAATNGSRVVRAEERGPVDTPHVLGRDVASILLQRGAADLL